MSLPKKSKKNSPEKPASLPVLRQQAEALQQSGKLKEAAARYLQIVAAVPGDGVCYYQLGNLYKQMAQPVKAEAHYRQAIKLKPGLISAHNNLGTVLKELDRLDEAMLCYRRALELKPDFAMAHNNLGVALKDTQQYEAAVQSLHRALELEPTHYKARYNLGKTLHELGQYDEALASYRHALDIQPDFAEAYRAQGDSLQEIGQIPASADCYRRFLALRPDHYDSISSLLFVLNYQANLPSGTILDEARRYGTLVLNQATPFQAWRNDPHADKRLRLGFVSGDLLRHPVAFFLESTLAQLDSDKIELYAYSNNPKEDDVTLRIKPCFTVWRKAHELDDAELAQQIHDDAIDILIDLSGHTARNRLPVFAWKPAPVQVSWLGYFATTGVPGMDYFLGDTHVCPSGEEDHFSETIWRLPDTYYCFTPPSLDIQPMPPPALRNGFVTFGCFNTRAKMGDAVIATWARILTALPESRLFLKTAALGEAQQQQAVRERYAAHGVAPERLRFEGKTPRKQYLEAYHEVDIALDPFPFPGGTTTAEGLWMGVPALTLRGDRFIGHQGETILRNVGLPEWIAADQDEYVAKAIDLAQNIGSLARLRGELRSMLLASPLCNAHLFTQNFEIAMRGMWRKWCEGPATTQAYTPLPMQTRQVSATEIEIEALLERAIAFQQAGRFEEAASRYHVILTDYPNHAAALSHLGLVLCQMDQLRNALPYLRRALEIDPGDAQGHLYLGLAYKGLGEFEAAAASYRRAAELAPENCLSHNYLGNTLRDLGRLDEAIASYQQALHLQPDVCQTHNNLANILYELGRFDAAAASFRRAIELNPDYAIAHNNLGNTLKALDQPDSAVGCYQRAAAIDPNYHEAYNNLGVALHGLGKLDAALSSYRQALLLKPDFAEAHNNLAGTLQDLSYLKEGLASHRRALELEPDNAEIYSNLLFAQNYMAEHTPAQMLAEAQGYGAMVRARAVPFQTWHSVPMPSKRLRVGLVSGDLRNHPVGLFLETTLAALDPEKFELFAYATVRREDELTRRIKPLFSSWNCLHGIDDAKAAQRIHEDAVDILIDLAGHTAHNRLPVFAWKPAPVQVAWLGYFATTGVPGMDYVLADPFVAPLGEENHFVETVWRLPEIYYCFTPPSELVEPSPLPALSNGYVTFGCFNKLTKMNDAVVALWAEVLHAVPGSRLFLKAHGLADVDHRQKIVERYAMYGIGPECLVFEGASSRREYLSAHHRVDIALDPFPFPGGATTADALWMGVPVLTLRGDRFIGHQGETILGNTGLTGWIANDKDDYVNKAATLAADLATLAVQRSHLRTQLLASPVCDASRFAHNLEDALEKMWQGWCERQTSRSG